MNNQNYNQRPGYYPPQYGYNYQQPYTPMAPYPTTAYGMPAPVPNYAFYPTIPDPSSYTPMYPVQYSQTRMATPTYPPYPPTPIVAPSYNYNTTNLISRPPRPLYPQLSQLHTYPPISNPGQSQVVSTDNNTQIVVKTEPSRDSVESNTSGISSEVSAGVSVFFIFWP